MKRLLNFVIIWLLAASLSCHDDFEDDHSENPLQNYLTAAGFTEMEKFIDDADYEFGFSFVPQTDSKIKSFVVKIPDDRDDGIRVVLWNVETAKPLVTAFTQAVKANTKLIFSFTPYALTKDKEYMITIHSDDYYYRLRPDNGDTTYPITAGNISITGYAYRSVAASEVLPQMPTEFVTNYYAGDVSFSFVPIE